MIFWLGDPGPGNDSHCDWTRMTVMNGLVFYKAARLPFILV